jgi:hypothetical protein
MHSPRRGAVGAGILAAAAYSLGAWAVAPQHPVGDEPHYLVITQSLLRDHDLKIENNHRQGDYLAYFPNPLKPDYLRRGTDGEIYSVHAPGLPALVAPVFALGGYVGVVSALVIAGAIGAATMWLVVWRVTRNRAASWFAWAAVTMSAPFFFHASAVYPDAIAALLLLVAILPLVDERALEPRWLVLVGAALALLPWLHTRLAILAASAAAVIVARRITVSSRRLLRLVALFACPIVSAAAWFAFFQSIYGTPNPSAAYGNATQSSMANIARGAAGLLFDQEFGLVASAPVYLCAITGLLLMVRREHRRLAIEVIVVCVPYFLLVAAFSMWWAGFSAPARFLAPLTLILGIPIAVWFATPKSHSGRIVGAALLAASLLITVAIISVGRGALLLNTHDGSSQLALWLSPAVNLAAALPSLARTSASRALVQAGLWILALMAANALAFAAERRGLSMTGTATVFGCTLAVTMMAAVSLNWRTVGAMPITPVSGGPALLRRLDPDTRQIALIYHPFRRVPLLDLPSRIELLSSPGVVDHLPAGIYEATATLPGHFRIATDAQEPPIEEWNVTAPVESWTRQFVLPIDVWQLRVEADAHVRARLGELSLRARARPGRSRRLDTDVETAHGARYGRTVVFRVAGGTFFEPSGFWILGHSIAEFAIAAEGQPAIRIFVRNSTANNDVYLQAGSWEQKLRLAPGQEQVVEVPLDVHRLGTLLKVETSSGARPADVDPKSDDRRLLGCWLEIR